MSLATTLTHPRSLTHPDQLPVRAPLTEGALHGGTVLIVSAVLSLHLSYVQVQTPRCYSARSTQYSNVPSGLSPRSNGLDLGVEEVVPSGVGKSLCDVHKVKSPSDTSLQSNARRSAVQTARESPQIF